MNVCSNVDCHHLFRHTCHYFYTSIWWPKTARFSMQSAVSYACIFSNKLVAMSFSRTMLASINLHYILSCRFLGAVVSEPSSCSCCSTTSSTAEGEIKLLLLSCIFMF